MGVRWGLDGDFPCHPLSQEGSDMGAATVGVRWSFIKLPKGGVCVVGTFINC